MAMDRHRHCVGDDLPSVAQLQHIESGPGRHGHRPGASHRDNSTPEGRAKNRRIDIRVTGK